MSSESELHQITLFTSDINGGHPLDIHFKTGGPAVPVHSAKPPLLVATILPSCRFGMRSPAKSNVENGAAFVVDMAKVKVPMAGLTSCKTSCIKLSLKNLHKHCVDCAIFTQYSIQGWVVGRSPKFHEILSESLRFAPGAGVDG